AAAGDVQPPPRNPLRLWRLRCSRRPAAAEAQTPARGSRHARRHAHDPRHRLRIYWIQDGLSANWTPDVREFAENNNIELVPTPTYASYLNRIEAHFRPITKFVVNNANYLDWHAFAHALARHIEHRNGPHRDHRIA